jgi:hypothetical protein
MTDQSDDDDKPLDPAIEQVRQRVRRLMLISALTLGLGIVAVFLAIGYRLMTYQPKGPPALVAGAAIPTLDRAALGLPAGARLVSTALDGDRLALTFEAPAGTTIVVIDLRSKAMVDRLMIAGE